MPVRKCVSEDGRGKNMTWKSWRSIYGISCELQLWNLLGVTEKPFGILITNAVMERNFLQIGTFMTWSKRNLLNNYLGISLTYLLGIVRKNVKMSQKYKLLKGIISWKKRSWKKNIMPEYPEDMTLQDNHLTVQSVQRRLSRSDTVWAQSSSILRSSIITTWSGRPCYWLHVLCMFYSNPTYIMYCILVHIYWLTLWFNKDTFHSIVINIVIACDDIPHCLLWPLRVRVGGFLSGHFHTCLRYSVLGVTWINCLSWCSFDSSYLDQQDMKIYFI